MNWSALSVEWPSAGTGMLLVLAGIALLAGIASLSRAPRTIEHLPATALARIGAGALVGAGGVVLAGAYLAPPIFALVMVALSILLAINLEWVRAVVATLVIGVSRRVRRGDRVRVGSVDGVVVGFHVGWLEVQTPLGRQTVSAAALVRSGGSTVRGRSVAPDAELVLRLTGDAGHERLEEAVRQTVMCSAYLALSHRPEIVCASQGARATVIIRAWALTEAHLARLESDLRTRCHTLGLQESPPCC